jgi:chemotaxis protein MotB
MSRRKKQHSQANHERWLVSYADFITLLFAFFVVLYSTAQVDNKKIVQVSAAIEGGFQELGAFTGNSGGPPERSGPPAAENPAPPTKPTPASTTAVEFRPDVDLLKRQLQEALGEEIRKHEIEMRVTPEGLVLSLSEVGFFNTGDATLLTDGQNTLTRIAKVLNAKGFTVRVEGHTDNVPMHNSRFKSNWDLSTARATEVVSLLVERYGFDPRQISAAGYSEYHPITSNDTEEGRRTNRRVDVVVVARSYRMAPSAAPPLHSGSQ